MNDRLLSLLGLIFSIFFGIPAWIALIIEHPSTLGIFYWVVAALAVALTFSLGCFIGFRACLKKYDRQSLDQTATITRLKSEGDEKDNAIIRLKRSLEDCELALAKMTGTEEQLITHRKARIRRCIRGMSFFLRAEVQAAIADGSVVLKNQYVEKNDPGGLFRYVMKRTSLKNNFSKYEPRQLTLVVYKETPGLFQETRPVLDDEEQHETFKLEDQEYYRDVLR